MLNAGKTSAEDRNQTDRGVPDPTKLRPNRKPNLPAIPTNFCAFPLLFGTMNAIIQTQLDRVETALNTLIESIASYNPSIPAANALLAADDDLNNGLKQRMNKLSRSQRFLFRYEMFYAFVHTNTSNM